MLDADQLVTLYLIRVSGGVSSFMAAVLCCVHCVLLVAVSLAILLLWPEDRRGTIHRGLLALFTSLHCPTKPETERGSQ